MPLRPLDYAVEQPETLQSRATLASRESHLQDCDDAEPFMPHLVLNDREIDEQHPRIVAPEDEHGDDPAIDAADATLQVGQRIAEEIRDNMRIEGRRRRRAVATHRPDSTPHGSK